MADLNLSKMPLSELKQLQRDVAKAVAGFEGRKKSEARAALEAKAKELGFSLAELVGVPASRARAPVLSKYRHPENADVTWSGRGRKPRWFSAAIASGKSPDSMAV